MKIFILSTLFCLISFLNFGQKLPPFPQWDNNNSPNCNNASFTKDSIVLNVKQKCASEGIMANWRPLASVNAEQLKFSVPAGAKIQVEITYKFKPAGGDLLSFYGTFDDEKEGNSFSLQLPNGDKQLPPSANFTTAILLINFGEDKPVFQSTKAMNGSMNFTFNVTTSSGETHTGSRAVIKAVNLKF